MPKQIANLELYEKKQQQCPNLETTFSRGARIGLDARRQPSPDHSRT